MKTGQLLRDTFRTLGAIAALAVPVAIALELPALAIDLDGAEGMDGVSAVLTALVIVFLDGVVLGLAAQALRGRTLELGTAAKDACSPGVAVVSGAASSTAACSHTSPLADAPSGASAATLAH